jgi:uncharacterized repeat protein (TIGR03833 family)
LVFIALQIIGKGRLKEFNVLFIKKFIIIGGVFMPITNRSAVPAGTHVLIEKKEDQRSGKLTEGVVKDILTNSSIHPRGIKVRLESGIVGRVQKIVG